VSAVCCQVEVSA